MNKYLSLLFSTLLGLILSWGNTLAAPGDLDLTFGSASPTRGPNAQVRTIAVQSDGKILIGGDFTSYSGIPRPYIARIDSGGVLDTSFVPPSFGGIISKILIQSDGKILVGGFFSTPTSRIIRLNQDGSIDTSFVVGGGFDGSVNDILIQNDGKIIVGGSFSTYQGFTRNDIIRLETNGNIDLSFNTGLGAQGAGGLIQDIETDGSRICVVGTFSMFGGLSNKNNIICLNSNGGVDSAWFSSAVTGANNFVGALAVQLDGKMIFGSSFTSYNGDSSRREIARMFPSNGNLDFSFNNTSPVTTFTSINTITIDHLQRILIGGNFGGLGKYRIARLTTTGSIDTSFVGGSALPGPSPNSALSAITLQPDGKILIGGQFTTYSGINRNYLARLDAESPLDTSPDSFSFPLLTGLTINTLTTSQPILLTGINTGISISVLSGQYQISTNGGTSYSACTSVAGTGYQGDYVRLCQMTPSSYFTTGTMSLTAGTYTTGRSVRTQGNVSVFTFMSQANLPLNTSLTSNLVTFQEVGGPWTMTLSSGMYAKNGGSRTPFTTSTTIVSGDTLRLSGMTSSSFNTTNSFTVSLSAEGQTFQNTWTLTTLPADTTPDTFSFTSLTGQQTGASVTSNIIQITGVNSSTSLSISNGQYQTSPDGIGSRSVCSSAAMTINPGTYVRLCQTTSSSYATTQTTTLTVGGVSAPWSTTTHGRVFPFSFGSMTAFSGEVVSSNPAQTITIVGGPWTMTVSNGEYSLDNGFSRSSTPFNIGSSLSVRVRGTALPTSGNVQTVMLSFTDGMRTQQGSFAITTVPNYDRSIDTTNVFFSSLTGVATGIAVVSNAVLMTGIEAPIQIYTLNGSYQTSADGINARSTCGVNGQVSPGEYVRLCQTSTTTYYTTQTTTVVIGQGIDQVSRTRSTTTHGRVRPFSLGPVPMTTLPSMPVTSDPVQISLVGGPRSISVSGGYYSLNNGVNRSDTTGAIVSGQTLIVQGFSDPVVGMTRTVTITISDGVRSLTVPRVITTVAPPPTPPSTIVDLMITSMTGSHSQAASGTTISQTITYQNKTGLAWIATGVVIDLDPGIGRAVQSVNLPYQPHPLNPQQIRINLPHLGPGASGSVVITGIVSGLSGQIVASSRSSISNSSMNDPLRSDNTRSLPGVTIISTGSQQPTGTVITGFITTGIVTGLISPLPLLRQLESRYTSILTQRNAPAIMSDVTNSPYLSHIASMVHNGIMIGSLSSQGSFFYPQRNLTRAELATVVGRILGLSSFQMPFVWSQIETRFVDVPRSSSYARFVQQLDTLGRIDTMGIGKGKDGSLYFNPHNAVTQTVMKDILIKLMTLRGYDPALVASLPQGNNLVSRGEVAYILAELIQYDPQTVAGYNHRLLRVLIKRLESLNGDISAERNLVQRIINAISRTDPAKMQSVGLMVQPLLRDMNDALRGSLSSTSPIGGLYRPGSDPFEALVESWSR